MKRALAYDTFARKTPTWCPGCGNFAIWTALKRALTELAIKPHETLVVYGIGCSGNMANTVYAYGWHGLHGRAVPVAIGAKLANKDLTVIVVGGDGDGYGEGLNHFVHALRSNVDVTYLVHNNGVYGLTTGQVSPTSKKGSKGKSTPDGVIDEALDPIAIALTAGGSFVARGFAGHEDHATSIIIEAIRHNGFSFVDILQPCVTFNALNTYAHYYEKVYSLQDDPSYASNDRQAAIKKTMETDRIPTGIFYRDAQRTTYYDELTYVRGTSLIRRNPQTRNMKALYREFI